MKRLRFPKQILVTGMMCLVVLLSACDTLNEKDKKRTETMDRYEAIVRWNQFDSMVDFIMRMY